MPLPSTPNSLRRPPAHGGSEFNNDLHREQSSHAGGMYNDDIGQVCVCILNTEKPCPQPWVIMRQGHRLHQTGTLCSTQSRWAPGTGLWEAGRGAAAGREAQLPPLGLHRHPQVTLRAGLSVHSCTEQGVTEPCSKSLTGTSVVPPRPPTAAVGDAPWTPGMRPPSPPLTACQALFCEQGTLTLETDKPINGQGHHSVRR